MRPKCCRGSRKLFLASVPIATALCASWGRAQTNTIDLPPLNGFQPLVIVGMTDEQWGAGDFTLDAFFAHASSTPNANGHGGNNLPIGGPQAFYIAIIDTGAQVNLINDATASQINFVSANRDGANPLTITGASGQETATIEDAVGFYMTDLNHGTGGTTLGVQNGTTLSGMWNASPAVTSPSSALPNIMGSPVVGLWQTIIKNSVPTHVTVGATTYKSPQVSFAPTNSAVPGTYGKIAITTTNNVGGPPALFPSDFTNAGDDPAQPTIWESLFATVTVSHTAGSSQASFLYDTGAQVSVLSSDTAATVGIYVNGENPTPADFTTDITGVGGATTKVKGYYINSFSMSSTGGPLSFNRVPVVILDLPDPRNPNNTLPGVIGTNLFGARDLIINMDTTGSGQTGLWVSPQIAWKLNGNGNWSNPSNWNVAFPSGIDTQANFFGVITGPKTVTLDSSFTTGSVSFDNSNRYTLNGPGTLTLDVSTDNAQINVGNGNHTINANITLADSTELNVNAASSVLTINGNVTASGAVMLIKNGPGTAEMKNVRAGGLAVNAGKLTILQNGGQIGTSKVSSLTVSTPDTVGTLDLKDNDLVVAGGTIGTRSGSVYTGITGLIQSGRNGGAWDGPGIVTSMTSATTGTYTSLGIATAAQAGITATGVWSGQTVSSSDVLVMYTYGGDATLDGKINIDDYVKIDSGASAGTSGWSNGDFNYDGKVNIDDYLIIDSNLPIQGPSLLAGSGVGESSGSQLSAVPEPAAVTGVLLAATLFGVQRRRRRP